MEFEPQKWRDRAWARFTRATRGRASDDPVIGRLEKRWYLETVAIEDMRRLMDWCRSKGLTVEFVTEQLGLYVMGDDHIRISSRLSPRKQVAILLHECGHHLCGASDSHGRFLAGYPETRPHVKRSMKHRISCLEEEIEAWHRGWKIATKLKLSVTRDYFDEVRVDCLRSYVKWAAKPNEV